MAGPVGQRRSWLIAASCFIWLLTSVALVGGQETPDATDLHGCPVDGDAAIQYLLGQKYWRGEGVPQDREEAVRRYRLAAEQGYVDARAVLRFVYYLGGVPEEKGNDAPDATDLRTRAADGDADAQFLLGGMHDFGEGVSEDDGEAVRWYRLAAEQGHAGAQHVLGLGYRGARGVPQDYGESVRWFRLAAEQGDAVAQRELGLSYRHGKGVPQDYGESVRWYRLAAEQGDAVAQRELGLSYRHGNGVPRDYEEAVRWYRLAAEQGDAGALASIVIMYTNGRGVPQDHEEAVRWYRRAAEQGLAIAQVNLVVMYYRGWGVPQDDVTAYMWANLAGDDWRSALREILETLEKRMSAGQIAAAQRAAREWRLARD